MIKEVSSSHANFADSAGGLSGIPSIVINQITASGNISASGAVHGTSFILNGNGQTLNSTGTKLLFADDTSQYTEIEIGRTGTNSQRISLFGHITASGDISASSATITALTGSFNHIITDDDTIEFRNKNTGVQTGRLKFDPTTGLNVQDNTGARTKIRAGRGEFLSLEAGVVGFNSLGSITASVNISASGDLIGNGLTIGGSTGPIEVFDNPFILKLASGSAGGSNDTLRSSDKNLFVNSGGGFDTVQIQNAGLVTTNITSSGNISASGDLTVNNINVASDIIVADELKLRAGGSVSPGFAILDSVNLGFFQNQLIIGGDGSIVEIEIGRSTGSNRKIEIYGQITASGDISASGDIIGDTIKTNTLQSPDTFLTFDTVLTGSQIRLVGGIANSGINLDNVSGKPILHGEGGFVNIGSSIDSTPIKLLHNVTASGDISASGDIVANKVTADVVDTSFETFLNFEAATAFTFIAPFPLTINFTGSSTSSMDVAGFVTASANTSTFSVQQTPPITLNIFDKLKITPSSSGLFSFSGSRTI